MTCAISEFSQKMNFIRRIRTPIRNQGQVVGRGRFTDRIGLRRRVYGQVKINAVPVRFSCRNFHRLLPSRYLRFCQVTSMQTANTIEPDPGNHNPDNNSCSANFIALINFHSIVLFDNGFTT